MTNKPKYCSSIKMALLNNGKIRFFFINPLGELIETIICDIEIVKKLKKTLTKVIKDQRENDKE